VSDVDYGRIFGPFPDVCSVPASHFIGYITADVRPDTGCVKVGYYIIVVLACDVRVRQLDKIIKCV